MSASSPFRKAKREAMRDHGMTFTQRVAAAIRIGQPVKSVKFEFAGKGAIWPISEQGNERA